MWKHRRVGWVSPTQWSYIQCRAYFSAAGFNGTGTILKIRCVCEDEVMRSGRGSILARLPTRSWCSPDAEVFQKPTYELVLVMDPCGIKHNQWENMCDVEIIFQSLVSLSMWLFLFFFPSGLWVPKSTELSGLYCWACHASEYIQRSFWEDDYHSKRQF